MAVRDADAKRADSDDLVLRVVERGVVEFALDHMHVVGDCLQIVKHLLPPAVSLWTKNREKKSSSKRRRRTLQHRLPVEMMCEILPGTYEDA